MEILVNNNQDLPIDEVFLKKIARFVLDWEGVKDVELSIALVGEDEIRKLNAAYRGKDYPTDVLSFESGIFAKETPGIPHLLGDVVICPSVAAKQAVDYGQTFEQEMALLLTHGILHLLGYDHENVEDAEQMEKLEREILAGIFATGDN
ncbi:MAG: rRNA maturation RNase YbeY [Firmicutes bacterium]|nr:rRNA maturation RNase YbeY [Bacillota bacterium]